MLDKFKKFFTPSAEAEQPKEPEMGNESNSQPQAAVVQTTAEMTDMQAALASQSAALEAANQKLAELSAQFDLAKAALAEVEAAKAALVAESKAKQLAVRKDKIVAAVGTAKADALLASMESVDDVAFDNIVAAMSTSLDKEADSKMFKEVGASAKVDLSKVADEENGVAKALKKKYQSK